MVSIDEKLDYLIQKVDYIFEHIVGSKMEVVEKTITKGLPKLPKDMPKVLDYSKVHEIGSRPCQHCGGFITWEYRPGIPWPIHVDKDGKIKGNGGCPSYAK